MNTGGIALLEQAIVALNREEKMGRDDLVLFARLCPQIDAAFARVVGGFDRSGEWALDGRKSMSGWLESQANMTPRDAHRVVRRAKFVEACPLTGTRWASGAVATEKLARIAALRHTYTLLLRSRSTPSSWSKDQSMKQS